MINAFFRLSSVLVLGFLFLISVVSCVVQPLESQMVKVADMAPESWTASAEGKAGIDHDWVRSFRDASLNRLVEEAIAKNADMRVAAARVKQVRATAALAGADAKPKLVAEFNTDRNKRQFVGFPFGGSSVQNGGFVDVRMQWEVDVWGRMRMGQKAAIADAQAVELDTKAAQAALAAQVCKAWFALGEAVEQRALTRRVVVIRKKSVKAIRERFERNLGDEGGGASQLRLAETDLATAKATVAQRESEMKLAQRRLELLCGRYPVGKLKGTRKLTRMPRKVPAGVPSDLLQRRPDVLSAERRYASAIARVKEANRAVFPILNLTAAGGTASDGLEDLIDHNFSTWSIGASLTQSILTGGQVRYERRRRSAVEEEALADLEGVVLMAFGEVENALMLEKWLQQRLENMVEASRFAEEAVSAADEDFLDGNGDILTLLAAQSRVVELGAQVLVLKRLRLENRVDLHLALGGEFRLKSK